MTSVDKTACARCNMVVLEVFPMMMQDIMAHTGTEAKILYTAIMKNVPFRKNLNKSELDMVDTLQTDKYTKIDVSLSYKLIVNFFTLSIPPPSRKWGAIPIDTEIEIGEDIERIRRARNSFVHKVDANVSNSLFENFFVTFIEIGKRIDAYLNKNPNNGYAHAIEQCKTCVLDPEVEKKLLDAIADIEQLKEKYRFCLENLGKEIHIFIGKSTEAAIANIKADKGKSDQLNPTKSEKMKSLANEYIDLYKFVHFIKDLEESYTKLKIIFHEVDDSEEIVRLINSFKEDFTSENINFKGAEKGSIILFIDVKNRVVLDDGLFQSNISTFIRKFFKFCNLKCYLHTQTVIASAAEEYEEPTINLPEMSTGSCLIGENRLVVVNFEVKNKIFHSPFSFDRTLKGFFKTLVLKGDGKDILGNTDVYAELVESGNTTTTEESFSQAQIPLKTTLPVSVNLRQQLNIKKSKNGNNYIEGCIKIGDALVFTEDDSELIICNPDGTDIHHMHLSHRPSWLANVDINTVAVGGCYSKNILIINISTRSVTSTINTSGKCSGISYNDNNLYVLIDRIIHVMDLTGKVIRTIPLPATYCYDIAIEGDRFVFIGHTSLYCCSLDGILIWEYKKINGQDFRRVTIDDKGNVYVTDCGYNTVAVVSDNGKQYRVFLSESDGLNTPWGIYFEKKENILLVSNNKDGKAFLFDVKKTK